MHDFFITKQNTPHLRLYTWLLGLSYAFSGFNCILGYIISGNKNQLSEIIDVGILLLAIIPIILTDRKKKNRGIVAVVASICMLFLITFFIFLGTGILGIFAIYAIELSIILCVIVYYQKGKQKKSNK